MGLVQPQKAGNISKEAVKQSIVQGCGDQTFAKQIPIGSENGRFQKWPISQKEREPGHISGRKRVFVDEMYLLEGFFNITQFFKVPFNFHLHNLFKKISRKTQH